MRLRGDIGVRAGAHRRANQIVGERHHPPRRPKRIVGAQLDVGGDRRLRFPRRRIELIAFERADGRIVDVLHRLPRAQREPVGQEAALRRRPIVVVLPAHIPLVRVVRHAEGRADVLQVVLHERTAVLLDERVERVAGLPVHEVRPRAEHAQRAQLAAVLVRHEIVRIVGPCARVAERPENLPRQQPSGRCAIGAVRVARGTLEHAGDVVARERRSRAGRPPHRGLRIDLDARKIESRDEGLDLVVAERPEQLGRDFDGAGARLGELGRVELQEPRLAVRIARGEAGIGPGRLFAQQHPSLRRRRGVRVDAARDLWRCHRRGADAIGEPARVRHVVDRVHVARAAVRRLARGVDEQVVRVFVEQIDGERLGAGRAATLRLAGDRIIVVEHRTGRRGASRRREGGEHDEERGAAAHDRALRRPATRRN